MTTGGNLFTATTSLIAAASAASLQKVQDLQSLLGQLDRTVTESEAHWKGPASAQFHVLMSQYHADSTMLNQSLAAIAQALKTSGINISGAEEMNVSNMNKINLPPAKLS